MRSKSKKKKFANRTCLGELLQGYIYFMHIKVLEHLEELPKCPCHFEIN